MEHPGLFLLAYCCLLYLVVKVCIWLAERLGL